MKSATILSIAMTTILSSSAFAGRKVEGLIEFKTDVGMMTSHSFMSGPRFVNDQVSDSLWPLYYAYVYSVPEMSTFTCFSGKVEHAQEALKAIISGSLGGPNGEELPVLRTMEYDSKADVLNLQIANTRPRDGQEYGDLVPVTLARCGKTELVALKGYAVSPKIMAALSGRNSGIVHFYASLLGINALKSRFIVKRSASMTGVKLSIKGVEKERVMIARPSQTCRFSIIQKDTETVMPNLEVGEEFMVREVSDGLFDDSNMSITLDRVNNQSMIEKGHDRVFITCSLNKDATLDDLDKGLGEIFDIKP